MYGILLSIEEEKVSSKDVRHSIWNQRRVAQSSNTEEVDT